MALFGLTASVNNTTDKKTTTGTSDTVGSQTGSQNTAGTSTQGTTATQNTTQNTSNTGSTAQNTAQTGSENTVQNTTSQTLSDPVMKALTDALGGLLGNTASATNPALAKVNAFDPASYIDQVMQGARSTAYSDLGQAIGGIKDSIGGGVNSAVALLQNKAQNQTEANLAGIQGQAVSTANQIVQGAAGANTADRAGDNSVLNTILSALKGGTTTATGATGTTTAQAGTSTGTSSEAGTSTGTTTNVQDVISSFSQILTSLLNSTSKTDVNSTTNENKLSVGATASGGF